MNPPISLGPTEYDDLLRRYAPEVAVLIPSFGSCGFRTRNQAAVLDWYADRHFAVYLGTDTPSPKRFFSRARAINNAARTAHQAGKSFYILADNDLIPSASHLATALELVHAYPAVIPHFTTCYTTHTGREELLKTGNTLRYEEKEIGSSSYIVIQDTAFAAINGMDECFEGWGPEDKAFVASLTRQLERPIRLDGARLHLWHPHDRSKQNRVQLERNRARYKTYLRSTKAEATVLAREYGIWLKHDQ